MFKLSLEHSFAAAHQLTHAYSKECNDNLHGHNWKVITEIETAFLVDGMVIDFKKLKEIINQLDHKNLNEVLDFEPTAENIARWLQEQVAKEIKDKRPEEILTNVSITVFEADKASITYC